MTKKKESAKQDRDEITVAKSIFDEIVEATLVLMKVATEDVITDISYSILDLPRQKIWTQSAPKMKLLPLLKGEAESYITIYKSLP